MSFAYITEEGAYIKKRGGNFVVGRNNEVVMDIPEQVLEGVTLVDGVQVSSRAMIEFLRLGIPVTWLSSRGAYFGRLSSTRHVHVFRQAKQIELRGSEFYLKVAKKCIAAKVHNQLTLLRRANRSAEKESVARTVKEILKYWNHIFQAKSTEELMGYEGITARMYFHALGELVPEGFHFERRSRRPPLDAFNSMLSFGYTLLMYDVYTALTGEGLHPYFGFLHALKNHHPALASDLMEEWRAVLVDSMVLSLVNHHEILPEHFEQAVTPLPQDEDVSSGEEQTRGIFLTREGRGIFLRAYEKKMRTANSYTAGKQSYRHSLCGQAAAYAQALMAENADMYEPIYLR